MNEIIKSITNHRSIRQYADQDISEEVLNEILASIQAMPSSINAQHTSVIVVRDKAKKKKISELAGNQAYIDQAPVFLVFVMDFYKTKLAAEKNGRTQVIHESLEGTAAGVFDAGLAMGGAIIAAESLGLGIVPIGGIRKDPKAIIELLELPEFTYPVAGLVVGYPDTESKKKPRMPLEGFVHENSYDKEKLNPIIDAYDAEMESYLKDIGREQEVNWSALTSSVYQYVYYPEVKPTLEAQGFKNDK
jgi:FMN reductase [NAD(P)H]